MEDGRQRPIRIPEESCSIDFQISPSDVGKKRMKIILQVRQLAILYNGCYRLCGFNLVYSPNNSFGSKSHVSSVKNNNKFYNDDDDDDDDHYSGSVTWQKHDQKRMVISADNLFNWPLTTASNSTIPCDAE